MTTTPFRRLRPRAAAAAASAVLVALTGCGGSGEEQSSASQVDPAAQTGAGVLADLTDGTLYEAITYARDNDLSYTVEAPSGEAVEVEDTREYTVVEQEPESGTELRPRDALTFVVEPAG